MGEKDPSPQTTLFILLGASAWPHSPELQRAEAFANAAQGVKGYFLQPQLFGLPSENLLDLFDSEKYADEQDQEIGEFLDQHLAEMKAQGSAGRDLLLYFIGHGGFAGDDHEYYLAIRRTRSGNPLASGLRVASLAYTLKQRARHLRRIIILDCCFSGAAFSAFQAGPDQVALEKTIDAFRGVSKTKGFPTKGTTLFSSSNQKSPSLLMSDGSSTMFTKAFLDALIHGASSQQDRLSLREVKETAWDLLSEMRDAPRPVVNSPDQSEGDVADIPFFPNPIAEQERSRAAEERTRIAEAVKQQARLAEEERVRKAEEDRRRQAERLAEVERLKRAEEEQERLRRAEEEKRRKAEEKEVQRTLGPNSPPDPLKSIRTPDAQRFWEPQSKPPGAVRSTTNSVNQPQRQPVVAETSKPPALPTTTTAKPTTFGFGVLAFTIFVFSALNTNFIPPLKGSGILVLALFYGLSGLIQFLVGMSEFRAGNTFRATALSSYGGFWFALGFTLWQNSIFSPKALGVFLLGWTIFSGFLFFGTYGNGKTLIAMFGTLFLTFLLLTIADLENVVGIGQISGWVGIFASLITGFLSLRIAIHRSEPTIPTSIIANPVPLGLGALGLATFVFSATEVGWSTNTMIIIGPILFQGGLVLLLAGMWEFRTGNTFGATTFSSYGAFWLAYGFTLWQHLLPNGLAIGFFLLGWTIFTGMMFLGTLRLNCAFIFVFLVLFLTFLLLTIGAFEGSNGFITIGGILGIITALSAWYITLASILSSGPGSFKLPTFPIS